MINLQIRVFLPGVQAERKIQHAFTFKAYAPAWIVRRPNFFDIQSEILREVEKEAIE